MEEPGWQYSPRLVLAWGRGGGIVVGGGVVLPVVGVGEKTLPWKYTLTKQCNSFMVHLSVY